MAGPFNQGNDGPTRHAVALRRLSGQMPRPPLAGIPVIHRKEVMSAHPADQLETEPCAGSQSAVLGRHCVSLTLFTAGCQSQPDRCASRIAL